MMTKDTKNFMMTSIRLTSVICWIRIATNWTEVGMERYHSFLVNDSFERTI